MWTKFYINQSIQLSVYRCYIIGSLHSGFSSSFFFQSFLVLLMSLYVTNFGKSTTLGSLHSGLSIFSHLLGFQIIICYYFRSVTALISSRPTKIHVQWSRVMRGFKAAEVTNPATFPPSQQVLFINSCAMQLFAAHCDNQTCNAAF